MVEDTIRNKYSKIVKKLTEKKLTISTMESCTGGLIASLLTDTEGASEIIKGAFVTYSNEAKIQQGVPEETIKEYGVYSYETSIEMAKACRKAYHADIGIGITGTFGNLDVNNPDSKKGAVFITIASDNKTESYGYIIPEHSTRHEYKLYVAVVIANWLLYSFLNEQYE